MKTETLGERIRRLRGKKSHQQFADELNITKSSLNMYERNERIPRDEVKVRIAKKLGMTVGEIFFNGVEYK